MKWPAAFYRRGVDQPDFTGKVVVIHCSSGQGGGVFEGARLVRIGFSHFVVGRKVELEPWRGESPSNVTAWFGINEIGQMYVYETLEEARRAHDPDGP